VRNTPSLLLLPWLLCTNLQWARWCWNLWHGQATVSLQSPCPSCESFSFIIMIFSDVSQPGRINSLLFQTDLMCDKCFKDDVYPCFCKSWEQVRRVLSYFTLFHAFPRFSAILLVCLPGFTRYSSLFSLFLVIPCYPSAIPLLSLAIHCHSTLCSAEHTLIRNKCFLHIGGYFTIVFFIKHCFSLR
jgi:hypothetical protein